MERYFENTGVLKCSFFEDLDDRKIGESEIYFSIGKVSIRQTIFIFKDNEQDFYLSKVLERTKEEGRGKFFSLLMGSSSCDKGEISQRLIKDISPQLTIEVSATPVIQNPDEIISVQLEDVKTQGMIKKAVILNDQFINLLKEGKIKTELSGGSEELVIDVALKKRDELLKGFKREKASINPLIFDPVAR